ncbi:MAG: toll/interleukin-1 receptor domain-containing protein [Candidatus Binatia bacterium]
MTSGTSEKPQEKAQKHHVPEINNILTDPRYHFFQDNIQRAVKVLENEPNAAKLIQTATDAIVAGKVQVFFSYKLKDRDRAEDLVKVLRGLLGNKIQITWAEDFPAGDPRNEKIRTSILNAHWFILLLPDPSDEMDWCLFETGIFRGKLQSVKLNKVFCLHHYKNPRPDQIDEFITVQVHPDKPQSLISQFLKPICHETEFFPGMGQLCDATDADISNAATEIIKAVLAPRPQTIRRRFEGLARIHLSDPYALKRRKDFSDEEINRLKDTNEKVRNAEPGEETERAILDVINQENIKILNEAAFRGWSENDKGVNPEALRIFGRDTRKVPENWGALVENVTTSGTDARWLGEICVAIKEAATGNIVKPTQATFTAADESKSVYRPFLYAVDEYPDGMVDAFFIVFVKVVSAVSDRITIPIEGYVELASSIRLGYRFRWEIVEPYKNVRNVYEVTALADALERVMTEAKSRGQHELEKLSLFFEGKKDRVNELYHIFIQTLQKLELLIKDGDVEGIRNILTKFEPANQEYLQLATRLFADMNARGSTKSPPQTEEQK